MFVDSIVYKLLTRTVAVEMKYQLRAFILYPEAGRRACPDESEQLAVNLVSSVVHEDAGNVDADHQDEVGDNLQPWQHINIPSSAHTAYLAKYQPPCRRRCRCHGAVCD